MLSLPFDSYERYRVTAEIVKVLWSARRRRPLRVLDVGGHFSSLKHFLPDAVVVVADLKEPPRFTYREGVPFLVDAYVRAAGGELPFPDGAFDVVTAHDTLEHVPEVARPAFVEDLLRVARRFLVLHGPMADDETGRAERRLARFWRQALGWEVHPLIEHLEMGLPTRASMEDLLRARRVPFTGIRNGNVAVWLTMMSLKHYVEALPESAPLHEQLDRSFNSLLAARDFAEPCYRTAYAVGKGSRESASIARVDASFTRLFDGNAPQITVADLEPLVGHLEDHAQHARGQFAELLHSVTQLQEAVRRKDDALRQKDDAIAQKEAEIAHKDAAIHTKDLRIGKAQTQMFERDEELAFRRAQVVEKDAELAERDELLARREGELAGTVDELTTIKGSVIYRLSSGLSRRFRRLLPSGTLRGRVLEAVVGAIRRLLDRRLRRRGLAPAEEAAAPDWADEYLAWVEEFEPKGSDLEVQRARARNLAYRPLLSIVMPVWNPPLEALKEAVGSVQGQTYDRWELCVADGGSQPAVRSFLTDLAKRDRRVRVRLLDRNLGISGNTNEALAVASGDYAAFLDHTDVLAAFALLEVATLVNRDPSVDVVYSDFDLIANDGRRFNPFFTPEWSPDLLLSTNYMAHLSVIRRRLVNEAGGLRPEMDGAQDWDLLFRVTEKTDRVRRIPKILYHWRADRSSAALSLDEKPYGRRAQEAAVQGHLDRRQRRGSVERTQEGDLRIRWELGERPSVSVIIPTRHNRVLLERCLRGLAASEYPMEILVVETAGHDDDKEAWYEQMKGVADLRVLWWQGPFNYSAVNNLAAEEATGDLLLFLNDDTEPASPGWVEELVGWAQQEDVGIVGAQLVAFDGSIQHGGVVVGLGGFADHLFKGAKPGQWTLVGSTMWYRNVSAVTGACLMMRRDVFERVGRWDESFELCGSDVELGLRIQRFGYRVICTPFAHVRHLEAATRGGYVPSADFATSYWHYQRYLHVGDPFFSPNLSPMHPVPRLRASDDVPASRVVSDVIGRDLVPKGPSDPIAEAVAFSQRLQATSEDVEQVRRLHEESRDLREIGSINWLIPDFESPFYGGIHTIFRFAHYFQERHGVKNRFVVIGTGPEDFIRSGIRAAFPSLGDATIVLCPWGTDEELEDVPDADASIATLWVTAYPLLRLRGTRRKFYFIQDYEPSFYPAGTVQALAEQTYRMGFYGIVNTPTLKEVYESQYGGAAVGFTPRVDELFRPDPHDGSSGQPFTVFYYGRPGHPRNCYEIAVGALHGLKQRLRDRVRIVTAGSWASADGDLDADFIEHLGFLEYQETADLYRRCDAGLVLSVSKHPSYLPMQLMASGSVVVSNINPAGSWLLRDGENCLLAPPNTRALSEALEKVLLDQDLRTRLSMEASANIEAEFRDWDGELERVYRFMCQPES